MRDADPAPAAVPAPLYRAVLLLMRLVLGAALVLVPTLFADEHRFGAFELLYVVCLLHAFWVVCGVIGARLRHLKSWAHVAAWVLLALALAQTLPLPLAGVVGAAEDAVATGAGVLIEPARKLGAVSLGGVALIRYAVRPAAATGVLVLAAAAAGLYWLVSSTLPGRKGARWVTWSVVLGLGLLGYWAVMAALGPAGAEAGGGRPVGAILVLGGDSLVPALLAGLPLGLLVVLRPLGWMPRRPAARRQSRWGWLDRAATVRISVGLAVVAVTAFALGMANVPRHVLVACAAVAAGVVLGGYLLVSPPQLGLRRPAGVALGLALWAAAALWLGTLVGGAPVPETRADPALEAACGALGPVRAVFGLGAGAVSTRAAFGSPGRPAGAGDDVDTDGYLLVRAEMGWAGLAVVVAGAAALAVRLLASWRRGRGPWPKTAVAAGLAAAGANLLYFRWDASALLAPNLLALAGALGVAMAWAGHGAAWHANRGAEFAESRWPLVAAAVGLLGAFGLAEARMLEAGGPGFDADKVLHFGTFAVVSLLLCYALGPAPTTRYLKSRLLAAVVLTAGLGALMELGQAALTEGRSFEWLDMTANALGAGLIALLWYVVRKGQAAPAPEPAG
jgi:hypothetical protein